MSKNKKILLMLARASLTRRWQHEIAASEARRAAISKRGGRKVDFGFTYDSGTNTEWLSVEQLRGLVNAMDIHR